MSAALAWLGKGAATVAGLVPGWLWALIVAGALAHGQVLTWQRDSARRELAELRADAETQEAMRREVARVAATARAASQTTYRAEMARITQETAHEITDLERRVAELTGELRQRPERPAAGGAGLPKGAAGAVACTGAGLYRTDAAFLVGEAARGDRLRIQLAECQRRYDAAVTLTTPTGAPAAPTPPEPPSQP